MTAAHRILFGAALCFLAALLAVDAKVAWAAHAGGQPNDLTAVKLSPIAAKSIELKARASQPEPHRSVTPLLTSLPSHPPVIPVASSRRTPQSPLKRLPIADAYLSAQFVRPPPSI